MTALSDVWEGLNPPYSTIVADPPWHYDAAWNGNGPRENDARVPFHYSTMSVAEIAELPVRSLAKAAHLYLWTTNRYLRDAYDVCTAWGFQPSQLLTWCKKPHGVGPGGAFSSTTEFVLFARSGPLSPLNRVDSSWWEWPRGAHSVKPAAFFDLVERVSPGPYVELFARAPRLGWDSWGKGYEGAA